jgi:uncharacterized protein (TIGR02118 family)
LEPGEERLIRPLRAFPTDRGGPVRRGSPTAYDQDRSKTAIAQEEDVMSIGYFVRYEGQSKESERFVDYYLNTHGAFMKDYPGIRSATVHMPVDGWTDPMTINPGNAFMLGEFRFESVEALNHALASEARVRARGDAGNFPHFEGKVTHQAFKKIVLF